MVPAGTYTCQAASGKSFRDAHRELLIQIVIDPFVRAPG